MTPQRSAYQTVILDAKSDDGNVQRTLEQLVNSSVLIVVAAAASGYYCMLDARLYIGNIGADRISLRLMG